MWRRWGEYLVAILGGNIVYILLQPYLPGLLRHQTFRVDPGLAVDFTLCAALFGVIRLLTRR